MEPPALRAAFRDELDTGATKANSRVAENLYRKTIGDGREAVVAAIRALPERTREQEEVKRSESRYFEQNEERMRYGSYRKKGYQIGSGVMEAGCKRVVGQRLDEAGMHWRQENAEAIVALRAAVLSSRPTDLRACDTVHEIYVREVSRGSPGVDTRPLATMLRNRAP